ncbi:hypothetical protein MRX96_026549 [Rhipicephalus microplus]
MWVYVDCWSALAYLLLLAGFIFTVLCVFLYATSSRIPLIIRYSEEFNFKDPSQPGQIFQYPHLGDEPSIELSVIVPAYEEEKRLPPYAGRVPGVFAGPGRYENIIKRDPNFTYEVIIVDDGSRDRTTSVGLQYSLKYGTENVRVLTLAKNRGKGGAVRLGMLSARGKLLLFADADGATKFSDVDKLEEVANELLKQSTNVVVVGSRAHLEKRTALPRGQYLGHSLCTDSISFREAATHLFTSLHVERWAFDVEILYIAQALKFPVAEVAVHWTEIEGSKVIGAWSIAAQPNKLK